MLETAFIKRLLSQPLGNGDKVDPLSWYMDIDQAVEREWASDQRIVWAAWHAQSVGAVFLFAYQEALRKLVGQSVDVPAALCVAEAVGTKPYQIQSRLAVGADSQLICSGEKSFVLGGACARSLYVWCKDERDSSFNHADAVKTCLVKVGVSGREIDFRPCIMPFSIVPDLPHASVRFEAVRVNENDVLPGDGYLDYVKPFRWWEDCAVSLGLTSWLLAQGIRQGWPGRVLNSILCVVFELSDLLENNQADEVSYLRFENIRQRLGELMKMTEALWLPDSKDMYEMWVRDRSILKVGGQARALRFQKSMESLGLQDLQ